MVLYPYARVGYIEKVKDIYSRRGAENAEVTCVFCKESIVLFSSFAFSAPLRENKTINLCHRLIYATRNLTVAAR